jgi:hypothetical protein
MFGNKFIPGLSDQKTLHVGDIEPWMDEKFLTNIFAQVCKYPLILTVASQQRC